MQRQQAEERPVDPSLSEDLSFVDGSRIPCGRTTWHALYCTDGGVRCVYRTNFGSEYTCKRRDCKDGPPPELDRWCKGGE